MLNLHELRSRQLPVGIRTKLGSLHQANRGKTWMKEPLHAFGLYTSTSISQSHASVPRV